MTFLTIVGLAALYAAGVFTGLVAPKIQAWFKGRVDSVKSKF